MDFRTAITIIANFVLVATLIAYGLRMFAQYHARGRWAKNITDLLAGAGMLGLALALLLTPKNAAVLMLISQTKAHTTLLIASNILLLAAIAAFGGITYWKPLRLLLERNIERGLKDDLPKVP